MPLKILVVDDEPEALGLIKSMVEPLGYEVLALPTAGKPSTTWIPRSLMALCWTC